MRALSPALVLALAMIAGSAMDATIKHLAQNNHVLLVACGRYVFGAMFSLAPYLHAGRPPITASMWRAHGLRGLFIAAGGTCFFWAFKVLPLAETITYSFVGLLIIPFAAVILVGEKLRASSIIAGLLGFLGVIVAAQGGPSATDSPLHALGVFVVLIAAALFAISMAMMRARAQSDGAPIAGLLSSLIPALILAGPALAFSSPPNWNDWPVFLLTRSCRNR
jgi:S-adenosylmethionine uptake transporter